MPILPNKSSPFLNVFNGYQKNITHFLMQKFFIDIMRKMSNCNFYKEKRYFGGKDVRHTCKHPHSQE
jgi:hypothetical protein